MTHYWHTFLLILKTPFVATELIWGIVPIYVGWLLNETTSPKASFRTAIQTGFTLVWAAAQWLWQYTGHRKFSAPAITVDGLLAVNMIVTLLVLSIGLLALISGLRKKFPKYCKFLGYSRFAAYFAITIFPMQAHYLDWKWEYLAAIAIFSVPTWLLVHVALMPVRR
jgi:hypothetical protein